VHEHTRQFHDELIQHVVELDQHRHTISLDPRDEDIISALADITDISREEIEAIAQDLRKRNAQPPLPRPRFIGSLSAALSTCLFPAVGLCLILLMVVVWRQTWRSPADNPESMHDHVGPNPALDTAATAFREAFKRCCPRPAWWNRVSIRGVHIRSYDDLLSYWQSKERSKNQFFKAAYQAVLDYPHEPAIVVTSIKLMPYGDSSYPHLIPLLEFAIERYFDYNEPLGNYSGKAADSIAGIVEKLASLYTRYQQPERALALIERLLASRAKAINDHLLELLALEHANALAELDRRDDAIAVLQHAIATYHGSWEKRLRQQLATYQEAGGKVSPPQLFPTDRPTALAPGNP
jgi:hypothetical protein